VTVVQLRTGLSIALLGQLDQTSLVVRHIRNCSLSNGLTGSRPKRYGFPACSVQFCPHPISALAPLYYQ
jgi:hypothetical protein